MKLSMQNKFMIPTVVLVAILMIVTGTISYVMSKNTLEDTIKERLTYTATENSKIMSSWLERTKLDIETWTQNKTLKTATLDSFVGKAARKTANSLLADMQKKYGFYELIAIAGVDGTIIAASAAEGINKINISDKGFFKQSIKGNMSVSPVYASQDRGKPVFAISFPIRISEEKITGVLVGMVDLTYFNNQFVNPIKIGKTGFAYLYNDQGLVLAHPEKSNILKLNMKHLDFGSEMLAEREGLKEYKYEGEAKIVAFNKIEGSSWAIAVEAASNDILAPVKRIAIITLIVSILGILLAAGVSVLIARTVAVPINRISNSLNQGANQVTASSGQVASSSQSLAEGASEQAASLEETSSSLEEMSSMTKQNANNADQADALMKETNVVINQASDSMVEVIESMENISKASDETSKIIKTIDEIAFQTNLLALNAAVEAARAGEAGAGFAVVADEVRNLALKAKDAAQNTSDLIEGTIKQINTGSGIVTKTNEAFTKVAESSGKVAELVAEISAATKEQAQGIDQVNTAVSQMDKVIQNTAAIAEESAAASEEMSAQSIKMRADVGELIVLASGAKDQNINTTKHESRRPVTAPPARIRHEKSGITASSKRGSQEVQANQIIPMDDDFQDF